MKGLGYESRTKIDVITTLVTRGMAALLQSSVEWVELSSEMKVYYGQASQFKFESANKRF